ncbi:aminopeptidase [Serratia sp. NA_112.1]|uniref:aminopeptidase n=1 Tax=Serratia sp. NA_112.1 TaxID=3415665 RepID=UPI004046E261
MFSRFYLKAGLLMAVLGGVFSVSAATQTAKDLPMGKFAADQIRHIATYFPGRMAGSPAELLTADYLNQQFSKMGYQSDIRSFNTRYLYTTKDGKKNWNNVTASSVIAAKNGSNPQQILIVAHFDTYTPQSDADLDNNLGGLTLQGVDDNASGIGVMLELAERLKNIPTTYGLRFVATSAEEIGSLGAQNYLQRMSPEEKRNTVLVINLDSLITGDRLYFNTGRNTPPKLAKQSRDRALDIAHRYGIAAATNPGSQEHPKGTGCCSDQEVFDKAAIPVLSVEATNWSLGNKDGYQQRAVSPHFPQGMSWHRPQYDNLQYLERNLPGRIDKRSRESVQILLPLIKELARAHPPKAAKKK